jgi:hypothetical protein
MWTRIFGWARGRKERRAKLAEMDGCIDEMLRRHQAVASSIDRNTGRVIVDPRAFAARPELLMEAARALFVELESDEMTPCQRSAYLAWRYENEVENGGHHQFFVNRGSDAIEPTIRALEQVGCVGHAALLREAGALWAAVPRQEPSDVEEFCAGALIGEFRQHDELFHRLEVRVDKQIAEFVSDHADAFVSQAQAT